VVIAIARVTADGAFVFNSGFSVIGHVLNSGTYQLSLAGASPPPDANIIPVALHEGGAFGPGLFAGPVAAGVITISNRTDFPVSGSLGDAAFYIIVSAVFP
jgi:hypothetical protein